MSDPTPPPATDPEKLEINADQDVNIGGSVIGRDQINVQGVAARDLQRLLTRAFVAGAVVAGLFLIFGFAGGVLAAQALNDLQREVGSSAQAAESAEWKFAQFAALQPGEQRTETFTEEEVSSFVKFALGPRLGLQPETGRVRYLGPPDDGRLVVGGVLDERYGALNNTQIVATFELQYGVPGEPLRMTSAYMKIGAPDPTYRSRFGWVPMPTPALRSFNESLNQSLGGNYELTSATGDRQTWAITTTGR